MEQRSFTRYLLRAPVIFSWIDSRGLNQQDGGFTRDISTAGVFVLCDAPPPPGTAVKLEILLPTLDAAAGDLRLQADGLIVRAEQKGERLGFAATSEFAI